MQQSYYDFRYEDEDTVMNEIEEFFSYVEAPQVEENLRAWEGSFEGGKFRHGAAYYPVSKLIISTSNRVD